MLNLKIFLDTTANLSQPDPTIGLGSYFYVEHVISSFPNARVCGTRLDSFLLAEKASARSVFLIRLNEAEQCEIQYPDRDRNSCLVYLYALLYSFHFQERDKITYKCVPKTFTLFVIFNRI